MTLEALTAVLGLLAVAVNVGVWFRLGNLTAKVEHVETRVAHLEARAVPVQA
jgi:hypothetical protein